MIRVEAAATTAHEVEAATLDNTAGAITFDGFEPMSHVYAHSL